MQRVLVLGPGGSGKSSLAAELGRRTGLPVTHLDVIFWRGDWTPTPRPEALGRLAAVVATERWIIDGNFLRAAADAGTPELDQRFERADTVIFLDLPRRTCLIRVLLRLARAKLRLPDVRLSGKARADLPEGGREGFDPAGLRWIWRYHRTDRPQVLARLGSLAGQARVVRLCHPREVTAYLVAEPRMV